MLKLALMEVAEDNVTNPGCDKSLLVTKWNQNKNKIYEVFVHFAQGLCLRPAAI